MLTIKQNIWGSRSG